MIFSDSLPTNNPDSVYHQGPPCRQYLIWSESFINRSDSARFPGKGPAFSEPDANGFVRLIRSGSFKCQPNYERIFLQGKSVV